MRAKDAVGRYGENVAARHLVEGASRSSRATGGARVGEIDIVAREGGVVVICEVKTRSSTAFGAPAEAITPVKAARLRELALWWLREHPVRRRAGALRRVSVLRSPTAALPRSQHLRGAF